jgi:hypothetical protein
MSARELEIEERLIAARLIHKNSLCADSGGDRKQADSWRVIISVIDFFNFLARPESDFRFPPRQIPPRQS